MIKSRFRDSIYNDRSHICLYCPDSMELLEGYLPVKVMSMVQEWIENNRTELLHMWETQEFKMLAPLE